MKLIGKPSSPYDYYDSVKERQVGRYLADEELSETMRKQMREFREDYCKNRELAVGSQECYLRSINFLGRYLVSQGITDFDKTTKENLQKYLNEIEGKSNSVKMWAKTAFKVFFRWKLTGRIRRSDKFPALVEWIIIPAPDKTPYEKQDLLTADELRALMKSAKNFRDRAFLSLLVDTGARLNEILNLRVKNAHMADEYPYITIERSKSKPRNVGLLDSIHDLGSWLEAHPHANRANFSESFIFMPIKGEKKQKNLEYLTSARAAEIVKRLAESAGIKKRVWIHGFRHLAVTNELVQGVPAKLIRESKGWSDKSTQIDRYSQTDWKDSVKYKRRLRGETVEDEAGNEIKKCWRCGTSNSAVRDICSKCTTPLNQSDYLKAIEEKDQAKSEMASMQTMLASVLEEQKQMKKAMERLAKPAARGTVGIAKLDARMRLTVKKAAKQALTPARGAKPGGRV
jgi:site-specific recombinase XerD